MSARSAPRLRYALITPARNEVAHLDRTIRAVAAQTHRPTRWIVVSDGSTDGTDELVLRAEARHPWITLVRRPAGGRAAFESKVAAWQAGWAALAEERVDLIGTLDADITVDPGYFEALLRHFEADPGLGIAGGAVHEVVGERVRRQHTSPTSVAGAVQLFRRQCVDDIGGLRPVPGGGEDAVAEIAARRAGWRVATVPSLPAWHDGPVLSGGGGVLSARFRHGRKNWVLGYHPLFQLAAAAGWLRRPPYVLGGVAMLAGYVWAAARREPRGVPDDLVAFLRGEQLARLRRAAAPVS